MPTLRHDARAGPALLPAVRRPAHVSERDAAGAAAFARRAGLPRAGAAVIRLWAARARWRGRSAGELFPAGVLRDVAARQRADADRGYRRAPAGDGRRRADRALGRISSSNSAAPRQIVTVPAATSGAASTATTPTTPEASSSAKAGAAAAAAAAAKHKAKSEAAPPGTGSSLSKPAPPSVVEHERGGSGQSYEQKSKNLPNVVSTG